MLWTHSDNRHNGPAYATKTDFCRLFESRMSQFYFVALMLTADEQKAELCFTRTIEDCVQSPRVFREWAQRWAIHNLIKNAIQITVPMHNASNAAPFLSVQGKHDFWTLVSAVVEFPAIERFVYLMTVMENYSDRECAAFLGCAIAEIASARIRAQKQLASTALAPIEPSSMRASA